MRWGRPRKVRELPSPTSAAYPFFSNFFFVVILHFSIVCYYISLNVCIFVIIRFFPNCPFFKYFKFSIFLFWCFVTVTVLLCDVSYGGCAFLRLPLQSGRWNDVACTELNTYICKAPKAHYPVPSVKPTVYGCPQVNSAWICIHTVHLFCKALWPNRL